MDLNIYTRSTTTTTKFEEPGAILGLGVPELLNSIT